MAKNRILVKSQIDKAKRKRRMRLASLSLLFILLAVGSVWSLNNERFLISEITVSNNTGVDEELVRDVIKQKTKGRHFWLIPRHNSLIFPEDDIVKSIKELSFNISSVDFRQTSLSSAILSIQKREPSVLWCEDTEDKKECFFADRESFIFSQAPIFSGNPMTVFKGGIEGVPIGKKFSDEDSLEKAQALALFLSENDIDVSYILIKEDGFRAHLSSGAVFIFDPKKVEEAAKNVITLISSEDLIREGFDLSKIEYVDLRFGNKIFWKP